MRRNRSLPPSLSPSPSRGASILSAETVSRFLFVHAAGWQGGLAAGAEPGFFSKGGRERGSESLPPIWLGRRRQKEINEGDLHLSQERSSASEEGTRAHRGPREDQGEKPLSNIRSSAPIESEREISLISSRGSPPPRGAAPVAHYANTPFMGGRGRRPRRKEGGQ